MMTGLCWINRMNERSRRVKVWETFKRENRKADGMLKKPQTHHTHF